VWKYTNYCSTAKISFLKFKDFWTLHDKIIKWKDVYFLECFLECFSLCFFFISLATSTKKESERKPKRKKPGTAKKKVQALHLNDSSILKFKFKFFIQFSQAKIG